MRYTHIVWDFNGTLMDDVDVAVAAVNDMLRKRGMPLTNKTDYLGMIESPIIEYYKKLFDLSVVPFETITEEFLASYDARIVACGLNPGAREALEAFAACGVNQCVVSSFEQGRLEALLTRLDVRQFFSRVSGADNRRAEGKIDRGEHWLRESGADPRRVLVVGDLLHDLELARALGADCCLIARGHQRRSDLETGGAPVYDTITEMTEDLLRE